MGIDIRNRDIYGREGILNVNGLKIKTPNYLPNQKDINSLSGSPFVKTSNFPDVEVGTYTHWINLQSIVSISESLEKYNQTRYYLKSNLKKMEKLNVKRKLLHFEFSRDVSTLSQSQLYTLFKLQDDVGADIIEIPNLSAAVNEYKQVLEKADKWRRSKGIDKMLMGIAKDSPDIPMLKDETKIIDCVGANLKKENPTLLFAIRNLLKQEDIWIHAFSVPRSFRAVKWNGTLSVLLNYYGIDTISAQVGHPKGARNYMLQLQGMTEDQKIEESQASRYFNPTDYSTLRSKDIIHDHNLSEFCNCPVCQKNNIDNIVKNVDTANANIRSHEVFAYKNESSNYQTAIRKNVSDEYFNSKKYAKEIESKFRGQS